MICLHLRPLVCLMRQIKWALGNYTMNSCPGLEEISGRRMAPSGAFPTGASIQRLSAGPTPSSCYFLSTLA